MIKMQPKFQRQRHGMPGLNLASMPDLIFTVLFFFMLVTHMRDDAVLLRYQVPDGSEVRKQQRHPAVVNIYIGKMLNTNGDIGGYAIQVNSELVTLPQLVPCLNRLRSSMPPEAQERFTVSLKADRHTPMGLIADVKRELQKAYALKISYSGTEKH